MLPTTTEQVHGRRLRVARLGRGSPVLLLHGYPENLQIWSRVAPRLAEEHEVFALDWPGLGWSEPWKGGATPMVLADRLVALLDHWGLERADVVGMDMGAQPALVFAAEHPDRVRRLVAMNALAIHDAETSWELQLLRRYRFNERVLGHLPRVVFARAEWTFLEGREKLPAELRADFWDSFRRPEVRDVLVRMCAGYQGTLPRLPALYEQIRCPTLILWASADKHFPVAHAQGLHARIPTSELVVLEGAGHWMAWERADEVSDALLRFLGGTP